MLAGVSGTGRVSRAARDTFSRDPVIDSDTTTPGRCALCASASSIDACRAPRVRMRSGSLWSMR